MNPRERSEPVPTTRLEELLIGTGAPPMTPPPALRQRVLRKASRVVRRRRRMAQVRTATVPILVFAVTWASAAYSISAVQRRVGDWLALKPPPPAQSQPPAPSAEGLADRTSPTRDRPASPRVSRGATLSVEEILDSDNPRAALYQAARQADTWAQVDGEGVWRRYYRRILRQVLWQ